MVVTWHRLQMEVYMQNFAKCFVVSVFKQGGFENMELARAHYCLALKLSPNNIRALYGLFLVRATVFCVSEV
jgi:hypothetical protein